MKSKREKKERSRSKIAATRKYNLTLLGLCLPGLICLLTFSYLPMFGIVIAFKDYVPIKGVFGSEWNGLDNFLFFFESQDAVRTIRNTVIYSVEFLILDLISRLPLYNALIPGAVQIANSYFAQDPAAVPCEVREKSYATKADNQRRFEVHGHTIDLMMARHGAEVIHICPQEDFTPAEPLKDDGYKLDGSIHGSAIVLKENYFCAIFPGEAHAVGGYVENHPGSIDKWVVKVRL